MRGYEGVYYNLISNMKVKYFSSITTVLHPLIELENTLKAVVRRECGEMTYSVWKWVSTITPLSSYNFRNKVNRAKSQPPLRILPPFLMD